MSKCSPMQRLQHVAAMEERIRLSREVHDGLMHSLTEVSLELQKACDLVEEAPKAARERLGEIQRLLAEEQRNLRLFFRELRSGGTDSCAPGPSLAARLGELVKTFQNVWGISAELRAEAVTAPIPAELANGAARIVREALVNAARHGRASAVRVELSAQDHHMRIGVADNGRGFPFRGQYDHAALTRLKLGPVCLKERVESLGGSLAIASTDAGARLDVILPLRQPGAGNGH